jgi:hypothetical protein
LVHLDQYYQNQEYINVTVLTSDLCIDDDFDNTCFSSQNFDLDYGTTWELYMQKPTFGTSKVEIHAYNGASSVRDTILVGFGSEVKTSKLNLASVLFDVQQLGQNLMVKAHSGDFIEVFNIKGNRMDAFEMKESNVFKMVNYAPGIYQVRINSNQVKLIQWK